MRKNFAFKGVLVHIKAPLISHIIYVPEDIVKKLPAGRLRVKGTMNGHPFALAIHFMKDGRRYFMVSKAFMKHIQATPGDEVHMKFTIADPDEVDVPEELAAIIEQDEYEKSTWKKLTPGMQRSLIHYVTSVKNVDSRIARAFHILQRAREILAEKEAKKKK